MASVNAPAAEEVIHRPAGLLGQFVERCVGYRQSNFPPGLHAGLPSRSLTFIVSFDAPLDLAAMPDRAQRPERFDALVGGLHAAPALIRHDGNQHGVQLEVTPFGARALFAMPAAALAWQVVPLDAVLGPLATELVERLSATQGWPARFAVIDEVLTRAVVDPPPPTPEVARTWSSLVRAGGACHVAALADDVGWSRRHLTQRFRAEFGLAPKVAARVLRFERAQRLVRHSDQTGLADVAARCGYADQSHMTREWGALAGSSPSAWLANEFPIVQDAPAPTGAGCAS